MGEINIMGETIPLLYIYIIVATIMVVALMCFLLFKFHDQKVQKAMEKERRETALNKFKDELAAAKEESDDLVETLGREFAALPYNDGHYLKGNALEGFNNVSDDGVLAYFLENIFKRLNNLTPDYIGERYLNGTKFYKYADAYVKELAAALKEDPSGNRTYEIAVRIANAAVFGSDGGGDKGLQLAKFIITIILLKANGDVGYVLTGIDRLVTIMITMVDVAAELDSAEREKELSSISEDSIVVKRLMKELVDAGNNQLEDTIKFIHSVSKRFNVRDITAKLFDKYPADDNGKLDFSKLEEEEKIELFAKEKIYDVLTIAFREGLEAHDNTDKEAYIKRMIATGINISLMDFCREQWDIKTDDVSLKDVYAEQKNIDPNDMEKFKKALRERLTGLPNVSDSLKIICAKFAEQLWRQPPQNMDKYEDIVLKEIQKQILRLQDMPNDPDK